MTARTGVPQVYGVRDTLADLKKFEPALYRESMKSIKKAAQPIKVEAERRVGSDPPLSGMAGSSRLGWDAPKAKTVQVLFGGRVSRSKGTWTLLKLRMAGAGGSLFDMAGRGSRGKTAQGAALIAALEGRRGDASRAMWPAVEAKMPVVEDAIMDATRDAAKIVNQNLLTTPTGRWL